MTGTRALARREGLPEALRVLLEETPREMWQAHPEFGQLTRFWMDRHLMFRRLVALMREEAEQALDARIDPRTHAARVSRLGGMFYGDLHGHHRIEDAHYFPALVALEPGLAEGFDLLEADHVAIDPLLEGFAADANAVIQADEGDRDPTARFHANLGRFAGLLERHLTDEEDLIVPVILRHGEGRLGG